MKTVALIYGGEGCEREISILSADEIYSMIDKTRFRVVRIRIDPEGWFFTDGDRPVPTYPVYLNGKRGFYLNGGILNVDLALPVLHGDLGEDGIIQGALEAAHLPYVGCGVLAGAICADKISAKLYASRLGIPTAEWICAEDDDQATLAEVKARLGLPVFVKPSGLGSSIGAGLATTDEELISAIRLARRLCKRVFIERAIDVGYEVECAFFDDGINRIFCAGGRVDPKGKAYDFGAKYEGKGAPIISHGRAVCRHSALIEEYSAALADAIGLRHMARIDFLVGRDGAVYFNEINTVPGMTRASLYPLVTEDAGLCRGEFINRLIEVRAE